MSTSITNAKERMYTADSKKVIVKGNPELYNDSSFHRNIVIGEALQAIESIILFSFSNYFLKFSECYKRIHKIEGPFLNDWYEYVEYGTTNQLSIILQRNGFSRETSLYIKQNRSKYVVVIDGILKLKASLSQCEDISIKKEVMDLMYNVSDLFVD